MLCMVLVIYVRFLYVTSHYAMGSIGHGPSLGLGHLYIFWVRWALKICKLSGSLGSESPVKGLSPISEHPHSGVDGTVSGWEEAKINSSNPLRYDHQSGGFIVTRAGLYYLYCQVSPTSLHG